ncbi:MAG TPA: P-type conjugative transfer protein TrbL [Stellaceae bacterium]|nr:P-type conjugative transfer protein TrbL [Stellaceae bacterium]
MKHLISLFALSLLAGAELTQTAVAAGTLNAAALVANFESNDNPAAVSGAPNSTASGLYGFQNGTWAEYAPQAGVSLSQCPTASSCGASQQTAVFYADFDQNGFSDWTCQNCDEKAAAAINADGVAASFAQGSTNAADYASLDTPDGLSSGLAYSTNTNLSTGVTTAGTSAATVTSTAGGTTPATGGALSNGVSAGALDTLTQSFQTFSNSITSGVSSAALGLFGILATIELFVMIFGLYLQGERPVWSDVVLHLTRYLIVVGLFMWLMQNGSTYVGDIINSLKDIGPQIGATAITPSALWAVGNNAANALAAQGMWSVNPFYFIPLSIAAFVIEITFALLVAWMVIALVEAYFVIGFAALFLAFGALRWAREIAISVIRFALAIGMKLLAIEVIVGVLTGFVNGQIANGQSLNVHGATTLLGISVLMCALSKFVPNTLERIIVGAPASLGHVSHLASAASLAAAPVMVAGGALALGAQGTRVAAAEMRAAQAVGAAPETAWARAMVMAGSASRHGMSAGGRAIVNTMAARTGGHSVFWRAAADLGHQARVVGAEAQRPSPPAGSASNS